ncbi:MAG: phosphate-starvation-inducible PsiE family protein [Aquificaceae bacterium]|nr:phosphate-starvation-inducible PsiE family protein [Aquificaceae bacterium]MDW8424077.1 phosphate-starvation-inducible PsiE family protein [Aquificaceae bacterium]
MKSSLRFTVEFLLRYKEFVSPSQALYYSLKLLMYSVIFLGLFLLIGEIFSTKLTFDGLVKKLTVRILELVILYEIFRAVLSIFEYHRVKLTFLVDASISFMLRELIIAVYSGRLDINLSISVGVILFILALLRITVVRFSPSVERISS